MPDRTQVSVIVALYNTGDRLFDLVASLDAQTLPQQQFEVVLVDDGSTDDTLATARSLAASRPNYVVETMPNSGWPGRPRNVGIDTAQGDYVFFSDHDDRFGPQALERLHEMAVRNESDIVYGKVVRVGRPTPYWSVWQRDVDVAELPGPVLSSRTVHKLFRRAFLLEHGLRFREGKVRLEDHEFMGRALPRAQVVSVLASVPCYWWIQRSDGSNNSNATIAPRRYWNEFGIAMSAWRQAAGPGPLLDAALTISISQALSRSVLRKFHRFPEDKQRRVFAAASRLVREQAPPELDGRLPVLRRLRVQALRVDESALVRVQRLGERIAIVTRTESLRYDGTNWQLAVSAQCQLDGKPLTVEGGSLVLPDELGADRESRRLLDSDYGSIQVTFRNRDNRVEWPVPGGQSRSSDTLQARVDAVLDLRADSFGHPFDPGRWDVLVRAQFLGTTTIRPVVVSGRVPTVPAGAKRPRVTHRGQLFFAILDKSVPPEATALEWRDGRLQITFARAGAPSQVAIGGGGPAARRPCFGDCVDGGSAEVDVASGGGLTKFAVWARHGLDPFVKVRYSGAAVTIRHDGVRLRAAAESGKLVVRCDTRSVAERVRDRWRIWRR